MARGQHLISVRRLRSRAETLVLGVRDSDRNTMGVAENHIGCRLQLGPYACDYLAELYRALIDSFAALTGRTPSQPIDVVLVDNVGVPQEPGQRMVAARVMDTCSFQEQQPDHPSRL